MEGYGHARGGTDGGAEGGEVTGGVGYGPGEEEEHCRGGLCFGGTESRDRGFEVVLEMISPWLCPVDSNSWKGKLGRLTTQTAGTPYLPFAAAFRMSTALLSFNLGILEMHGNQSNLMSCGSIGKHPPMTPPR